MMTETNAVKQVVGNIFFPDRDKMCKWSIEKKDVHIKV